MFRGARVCLGSLGCLGPSLVTLFLWREGRVLLIWRLNFYV